MILQVWSMEEQSCSSWDIIWNPCKFGFVFRWCLRFVRWDSSPLSHHHTFSKHFKANPNKSCGYLPSWTDVFDAFHQDPWFNFLNDNEKTVRVYSPRHPNTFVSQCSNPKTYPEKGFQTPTHQVSGGLWMIGVGDENTTQLCGDYDRPWNKDPLLTNQ